MTRKKLMFDVLESDLECAKKRRVTHCEYVLKHVASFHTSTTFMDYLHGDVKPDEARFACLYEYARESKTLREFAANNDIEKLGQFAPFASTARLAFPHEMMGIIECQSFPTKDWQELSQSERETIMGPDKPIKAPPLHMPDGRHLKATGILDSLGEIGDGLKTIVEDHNPRAGKTAKGYEALPAITHSRGSLYLALFTLDFSESRTHLLKRFDEWLKLPENQTLLEKHHTLYIREVSDIPLDRLKDLAAWRLYRELDNDIQEANRFAEANRKRFAMQKNRNLAKSKRNSEAIKLGKPRHFRDAKKRDEIDSNLFSQLCDPSEAQSEAWKYLEILFPEEFAPPSQPFQK